MGGVEVWVFGSVGVKGVWGSRGARVAGLGGGLVFSASFVLG